MFLIDNLSYQYDTENLMQFALDGVSLEIPKGEWWSIIGANGSGKSTLARHLNGLLVSGMGTVWVDGLDTARPDNLGTIRRKVGIVFQNPDNQIIGNSVEEDVAFGPENLGVDPIEIRARITKSLARVGLSGFEQADPNNLSGGQKQRVAIAGALAMEPEALIIDEATAMLDPEGCKEVFAVLQDLHKQGLTIVMITHNMSEVVLSQKVAVMSGGKLMAIGTPKEIFAQTDNLKSWSIELPIINQIGEVLAEGIDDEKLAAALKTVLTMEDMVNLLAR